MPLLKRSASQLHTTDQLQAVTIMLVEALIVIGILIAVLFYKNGPSSDLLAEVAGGSDVRSIAGENCCSPAAGTSVSARIALAITHFMPR
jgi:hypothetical protein